MEAALWRKFEKEVRRHFYVVRQGTIEVVLPSKGEVHMRLHQPGDFTGELDTSTVNFNPSEPQSRLSEPA
jgi:hypothetical protein